MLFKGQLVTNLSGSMNGVTASHNRGGAYLRDKAIPVNPSTVFQTAVRDLFASLASAWVNILTTTQREAWGIYADTVPVTNAIGDPHFITGLAWYQAMNVPRLQAGLDRVDDGPTNFSRADLTLPTADPPDAGADTVDVNFDDGDAWANEVGGGLLVFISRPVNASVNFFTGPYRFAGLIPGEAAPPTSPESIDLPFPIAPGNKIFLRYRAVEADGRISSSFRGFGIGA